MSLKMKSELPNYEKYYVDNHITQKIKNENFKVHQKEAEIYDVIHTEIFNKYEQKNTNNDIEFICKIIRLKNCSVLDVGCGTGNISLKFLKYGFKVTGIDISQKMLDILHTKTTSKLLNLKNIDIDLFLAETKEKYDIICFSSVVHHLPNFFDTIGNSIKILNAGGIIYITHEPLKKDSNTSNFFSKAILTIDYLLFNILLKLKRIKFSIDYTYSDYHCEKGIEIKDMVDYLETKSFEIIYVKEFNVCKSAIFSYLDDKFNNNKRLFKIIAKKTDI